MATKRTDPDTAAPDAWAGPELTVADRVTVAAWVGDREVSVDLEPGPIPPGTPWVIVAHLVATGAATPIAPAQPEE